MLLFGRLSLSLTDNKPDWPSGLFLINVLALFLHCYSGGEDINFSNLFSFDTTNFQINILTCYKNSIFCSFSLFSCICFSLHCLFLNLMNNIMDNVMVTNEAQVTLKFVLVQHKLRLVVWHSCTQKIIVDYLPRIFVVPVVVLSQVIYMTSLIGF